MKRTLLIASIIMILLLACIVLTGCNKADNGDGTSNGKNEEQILTLDFGDEELFQAKFEYPKNSDLEVVPDEDDETHVKITNEKENYEMDIYLGDEMEDTFLAGQEEDKEEEGYKEAKYGNFDGYYYNFGEGNITGNIVLDKETYNEYMYIYYTIDVNMDAKKSVEDVYKSKEIQNILNSFGYKYITPVEETEEIAE